jgi:transposase
MSERFVKVDRDTPMLLPVDLRDWVPADDAVHFVLEVVDRIPESLFSVNRRGSGSPQYPPHMMMALLIYCYSQGVFSSGRTERATWHNIAVRFLTGDTHPDHGTICTFRREHRGAIKEVFLQVMRLAREMGVLKIGTVRVDGRISRQTRANKKVFATIEPRNWKPKSSNHSKSVAAYRRTEEQSERTPCSVRSGIEQPADLVA